MLERLHLSYYRLDKVKEISILECPSRSLLDIVGANPNSKISEYAAINIYHYGGEKIRLILRVENSMLEKIFDQFGCDIQIEPGEVYSCVTAFINNSQGLYFWLLQYGERIEILAPKDVRKTYLKKLRFIFTHYDTPPETMLLSQVTRPSVAGSKIISNAPLPPSANER